MRNKLLVILCFFFALVYVIGCTQAPQTPTATQTQTSGGANQPTQNQISPQKQTISADVQDLLDKHKSKVSNIYYKYKGPQTSDNFYDFYVKGGKIKYKPYFASKVLDRQDSFDSIFIDKAAKTAQSYCADRTCVYKGKKGDLNYDDAYISTIFDWIDVKQAAKLGEEVIDDRSTWKLQTDKGIVWVDTYYGIPLKADSSGKSYRFTQLSVNSVQDSDVTPS